MSHSKNCILSTQCKAVDSAQCNRFCGFYIAMHGASGTGGRAGFANLPADYKYVTLQNSPAREEQAEAYRKLEAYCKTFSRVFEPDGERIKSLYLFSENPGTGKSTSAAAITNAYLMTTYIGAIKNGVQPEQRPALFLDCNAWQTDYNTFNRSSIPRDIAEPAADRYYRIMEAAKRVPFLVADDIGVRSASEAFRADLHTIINERVTQWLPAVYTSNIPIDALESVFDRRLADRIRDMTIVVPFVGSSKRGIRK